MTEKKQTAQSLNIRAAKAIADTVRSTLGPAGMDKMMVDGGGNVIVTNDGATILQQLDITHPGAKMIVEAANTQETMCYDGTTTTTILAGELLANTQELFNKGLHPNVVCKGYRQATKWAVEHINGITIENIEPYLREVARTAITGKALESNEAQVSALCVEAVNRAKGDIKRISVVCQPGGSLEDSYCFSGKILNQTFMMSSMKNEPTPQVVLINSGLSKKEDSVQVNVSNVGDYKSYQEYANKDIWQEKVEKIASLLPKGGVVFCRDSVNELVAALLSKNNISVAQRVPPSDMEAMAILLGTTVAHSVEDLNGADPAGKVLQFTMGDMQYISIEDVDGGENTVTTLVLRGATRQTLDETERGFDDALGVVCLAFNSERIVRGGGSSYMNAALNLRSRAAEIGGRAQMAIEAFANALESIPATIAQNAGHDPLDTILELRNEHLQGNFDYGPDIYNGGTISMGGANVWEPYELVKQAIQSASEVSISILRIDDIIGRKSED